MKKPYQKPTFKPAGNLSDRTAATIVSAVVLPADKDDKDDDQ